MNINKKKRIGFLLLKKLRRKSLRRLTQTTGYNWEQYIDGFFIGSISLIVLKLGYRICYEENPIWYINIGFFIFGIALQLKYDILKNLRENFVTLWKKLLGFNYYGMPAINPKNIFEERPEIDIFGGTFVNKFWQYIYIKLVQIRLWLMKEL